MKMFEWNDAFLTNISEIDNQHKKLVSMINELYDTMIYGKKKYMLTELINKLIDYTKYHFSTEEEYMMRFKYTDYETHKKEHDGFRYKVLEFQREYIDDRIDLSIELFQYLKQWLTDHILGTDMKFVPLFSKNGLI